VKTVFTTPDHPDHPVEAHVEGLRTIDAMPVCVMQNQTQAPLRWR